MKILITGGAGFIGSHLIEYLLKNTNHDIICIDYLYSGRLENINDFLSSYKSRFTFLYGNINNFDFKDNFIVNQIYNVDQIYHLACPASPPFYQKDPLFTLKTNTNGTYNILEFAKECNCPILFTSTSEIYGDPTESPQSESYRGNVNTLGPRSCYDEGKRISETIFTEYKNLFNVDIRICRIFNTYGPNLNPVDGRVVSNFIRQSLNNEDITIYGDGSQTRSFCYVDDLVQGLIKLMNQPNQNEIYHSPINLGNPHEITIKQLVDIIIKLTNSKSKLVYCDLPKDDPMRRCPDISLAKSILNWEPKISLEEGLSKMIEKYKN